MASTKGNLVKTIIWLVLAIVLWSVGFFNYIDTPEEDKVLAWFLWGAFCVIPMIRIVWRTIRKSTADGARKGANSYTIDLDRGVVYNHPVRDAIIGFLGGVIGGLAVGPVGLPVLIIVNLITMIKLIKVVKGEVKGN